MTNEGKAYAIECLKWFTEYNEEEYCGGDRIQNEDGKWFYYIDERDFKMFGMIIEWLEQELKATTTQQITESNQQITKSLQDSLKAGGNSATMLNYELSAIDRRLADISVTLAMIVDRLGGESE